MHFLYLLLALLAAPFWEAKAPADWSDMELQELFKDSPWAEVVNPDPGVQVYLASARPMLEAEAETLRRSKVPPENPDLDYADFLREDQGKHIVLAIPYPNMKALSDAGEARRMEEDSVMRVGRRHYKMTGHFPPTPSDPVLRMVFPKNVGPGDKSLIFELYLPGVMNPLRMAEFRIKELLYKGKLEM